MTPQRSLSLLVAAAAVLTACATPTGVALGAPAAPTPMTGVVTALRAHRVLPEGTIVTDVTLSTTQGVVTIEMEGGVLDGTGMLTGEYTELHLADRIIVPVTSDASGALEAVDAPVLLAGSGRVSALAVTDYVYDGHRWDYGDLPLGWRFNASNAPSGALGALQAAADTWESDPRSAIDFTYSGTTGATPGTADDINTVGWRQNASGGQLASCVIWFFDTKATLGYNRIVEFDIDFNRAYAWSTNGASSTYDIQSVALHEFGHSLHLGDLHDATATSAQEIMNGYIGAGELLRILGAGDLAGAHAIYPDGAGPPPPPPPPPPSDTTPPTSNGSVSPAGWTRGPVTFAMSASDGGSGVSALYYGVPGSGTQPYSSPVSFNGEGVTPISYWAVDSAGNTEAAKSVEARIDRTAPSVSSDAGSGYVGEAVVRISASDSLSGVARITYRVDGGVAADSPGSTAVVTIVTAGAHTLEYTATDAAGNTKSGTAHLMVEPRDVEAPVTTASGAPSSWTSRTVSVVLEASGDDVATTYYQIGQGPLSPYSTPLEVSAEGETTLRYWSTDRTGNTEAPRIAIVRIDRTEPTVVFAPAPLYRSAAEIPISASDVHSGVASILARIDGSVWQPVAVPSASIVCTAPGRHSMGYIVFDGAGNMREGTAAFVVRTPATITSRPTAPLSLTRRRGTAWASLSAIIRRADGSRIPRASVMLQRSTNGRTWSTVYRATASASGSVSRRVSFTRAGTTHWRWRVTSDDVRGHDAATSRVLRIRVR